MQCQLLPTLVTDVQVPATRPRTVIGIRADVQTRERPRRRVMRHSRRASPHSRPLPAGDSMMPTYLIAACAGSLRVGLRCINIQAGRSHVEPTRVLPGCRHRQGPLGNMCAPSLVSELDGARSSRRARSWWAVGDAGVAGGRLCVHARTAEIAQLRLRLDGPLPQGGSVRPSMGRGREGRVRPGAGRALRADCVLRPGRRPGR
jgi:hypothetical protein